MPLDTVCDMLETLASTRQKKERMKLLREFHKDPVFYKTVQMAMDMDKQYFVNVLPKVEDWVDATSGEIFAFLEGLNKKGSATKADKIKLSEYAAASDGAKRIIRAIIGKDLKCGCGPKTIAEVDPDWCFFVPYQRCSKEDKLGKVSYPAVVQLKGDGQFAYGFGSPHERTGKHFLSRHGSGYDLFGKVEESVRVLVDQAKAWRPDLGDFVTIGEMLVKNEEGTGWLDRQTSNGLIEKFASGTGTAELAERVEYLLWNILPLEDFEAWSSDMEYDYTWGWLVDHEKAINKLPHLQLIDYEYVEDFEAARAFYYKCRRQNLEGAVLKELKTKWSWNTSPDQIKLKNTSEGEVKIVKANYGKSTGKYATVMGSLTVRSECGGILTDVGMGFSDEQRKLGLEWWDNHEDGVMTVRYTTVIDDKTGRETKCLDNARFVETRFTEKTTADTLEYLEELCKPPELVEA